MKRAAECEQDEAAEQNHPDSEESDRGLNAVLGGDSRTRPDEDRAEDEGSEYALRERRIRLYDFAQRCVERPVQREEGQQPRECRTRKHRDPAEPISEVTVHRDSFPWRRPPTDNVRFDRLNPSRNWIRPMETREAVCPDGPGRPR